MDLSTDMQRVVREQRLGFVATVSREGRPNVSPKGTLNVWDGQHLMFADIVSPGTIENLQVHPDVEINVVDPISRKGYRFRGTAIVHTSGPGFEHGLALMTASGSTSVSSVRSIVVVEVTWAAPLISPAYATGALEGDVIQRWLHHHTTLHSAKTDDTVRPE